MNQLTKFSAHALRQAILLVVALSPLQAATYYVSSAGSNANAGTGIRALAEVHGSSLNGQNGYDCVVTNITGGTTLSYFCNSVGPPSFTNGLQIEFEVQNGSGPTSVAGAPSGLSLFTKYYIRDV